MFGNLFGWNIVDVGFTSTGELWMEIEKADFVSGTNQRYRGIFKTFVEFPPQPIGAAKSEPLPPDEGNPT